MPQRVRGVVDADREAFLTRSVARLLQRAGPWPGLVPGALTKAFGGRAGPNAPYPCDYRLWPESLVLQRHLQGWEASEDGARTVAGQCTSAARRHRLPLLAALCDTGWWWTVDPGTPILHVPHLRFIPHPVPPRGYPALTTLMEEAGASVTAVVLAPPWAGPVLGRRPETVGQLARLIGAGVAGRAAITAAARVGGVAAFQAAIRALFEERPREADFG